MNVFWVCAGLLAFAASLFVLWPLWLYRRSPVSSASRERVNVDLYAERMTELDKARSAGNIARDDYASLEVEAKRDLLDDTTLPDAILPDATLNAVSPARVPVSGDTHATRPGARMLPVIALLVPLIAVVIYADFGFERGSIADLRLSDSLLSVDPSDHANFRPLVEQLAGRMATQPDNQEGWLLLARSWQRLQEPGKAVVIYEKLMAESTDARLASYYAEALFAADGRRLTDRVESAVAAALQLNPDDLTMLELRAIAALRNNDPEAALSWLERALATGVDGDDAALIQQAIDKIKAGRDAPSAMSPPPASEARGRVLKVLVEVAPGLQVPPDAVVFVYARAVKGPPAPLAVQKIGIADLPGIISLDESMTMIQGMGLADFDEVQVIARISIRGQVVPARGDYEARSPGVDLTVSQPVIKLLVEHPVVID